MIKSNVEYIKLFRHASKWDGDDEYYVVTVESAVSIIAILDSDRTQLKMDDNEYGELY